MSAPTATLYSEASLRRLARNAGAAVVESVTEVTYVSGAVTYRATRGDS